MTVLSMATDVLFPYWVRRGAGWVSQMRGPLPSRDRLMVARTGEVMRPLSWNRDTLEVKVARRART